METHKLNHYIPCFMLKYWEQRKALRYGVHVYHIREGQITFERSRGRRRFAFAAVEDLYVPIIDGCRITAIEMGWLNNFETALAHIVRCVHRDEQLAIRDALTLTNFGMGLFSLEQRSRYNIETLIKLIEGEPSFRGLISANPERELKRLVLENMINVVTECYGRYEPLQVKFLYAKGQSFIVTDRPYFADPEVHEHFMVLTNKLGVLYWKGDNRPQYLVGNAPPDFVDLMNKTIVVRARDWIVADNIDQLRHYVEIYNSQEAARDRTTDRIIGLTPRTSRAGWSFRSPKEAID